MLGDVDELHALLLRCCIPSSEMTLVKAWTIWSGGYCLQADVSIRQIGVLRIQLAFGSLMSIFLKA
jgi:hypothetical protein